jgi:hypothetical protein
MMALNPNLKTTENQTIVSGPCIAGRKTAGSGGMEELTGADAVALLPAATASADGKATAAQIALLNALNSREQIGIVTADWSPTNDTTLQDIPGLSIASVPANTSYIISAWMLVNVIAAADFVIKLYVESVPQELAVQVYFISNVITRHSASLSPDATEATFNFLNNEVTVVTMYGYIKTHASLAGDIKLQMAERINSTAPTVYAGAHMSLKRVVV